MECNIYFKVQIDLNISGSITVISVKSKVCKLVAQNRTEILNIILKVFTTSFYFINLRAITATITTKMANLWCVCSPVNILS